MIKERQLGPAVTRPQYNFYIIHWQWCAPGLVMCECRWTAQLQWHDLAQPQLCKASPQPCTLCHLTLCSDSLPFSVLTLWSCLHFLFSCSARSPLPHFALPSTLSPFSLSLQCSPFTHSYNFNNSLRSMWLVSRFICFALLPCPFAPPPPFQSLPSNFPSPNMFAVSKPAFPVHFWTG